MSQPTQQAKAAKSIKADLRLRWPGVPFRVRSHGFAGGTAVRITWPKGKGPAREAVYEVVARYEEGAFDGATDSYVYNMNEASAAFRAMNGSAKYIHCQNQ
jgi:hypothetical protein